MEESPDPNPYTVIGHVDNPNAQSTRDSPPLPYLLDVRVGDKFVYTGPEVNRGRGWNLLPNTILVVDFIVESDDFNPWYSYLLCYGERPQLTSKYFSARRIRKMIKDEQLRKIERNLYRDIAGYHTKFMGHGSERAHARRNSY